MVVSAVRRRSTLLLLLGGACGCAHALQLGTIPLHALASRPSGLPLRCPHVVAEAAAAAAKPTEDGGGFGVYDPSRIRNFCIIAHIDHGKSTLADRLLQTTKTVEDREMQQQLLDNMDIERERGITIKLQASRMNYLANDGKWYVLNLIDTPGHVDFQYEVSRSLAACEGALLVVDAAQGVEAQTIANVYLALDNDLEIVPVLNKIDLPGADVDMTAQEVESTIGLDCTDAIPASAKVGIGVPEILEAIVQRVPPPPVTADQPLRALIFDSYYDAYRGVVVFIRVVDGELRKGDKVRFVASGMAYDVLEVGTLAPGREKPCEVLRAGEVGYLHGAIKSVTDARVGDTIVNARQTNEDSGGALEGYREPVPVVYCGLFPVETTQYQLLRESLQKLQLNDASLCFEPETSSAMGFGFRCGFLGLLHMEIIQERLEREYNLDLIVTAPSVVYKCEMNDGSIVDVDAPGKLPDPGERGDVQEPYVSLEIFCPKEYTGTLMELCQQRRGEYVDQKFLTEQRVSIKYDLPLAEVITDFFDQLKSRSKGYASMEYSVTGYRTNSLVRLDILINGDPASPLASIVHNDAAHSTGKALTRKLKELIPRQQFKVPIQAAIGAKIVASSTISPIRKDVTAKCYGGDISRKKKLLNKQAKGKKRMKAIGKVSVPQEAFMAVLNLND
jgi:GTP-binding protein LepA